MTLILSIVGAIAFIAALAAWASAMEKKRTREMRAAVEALGWSFTETIPASEAPGAGRFDLFDRGHTRTVRNLAVGERGGVRVTMFDYSYVTGSGRTRQEWNQTVLHLQADGMELPAFSLRPENIFHKIGGLFGYQDIDVPDRPLFSRKYLLRGSDEPAIRGVFQGPVLDFCEANPHTCSDGEGGELLFWRYSRRVRPAEVGALLDRGVELAGRLRGATRALAGASGA